MSVRCRADSQPSPGAVILTTNRHTGPIRGVVVYPNPFNARTEIRVDLRERAVIRVEIYDTRGRLLRVLNKVGDGAGRVQVAWDGSDEDGSALASDRYRVKVHASGQTVVTKAFLVR